jgi:hypothetical protein
MGGAWRPLNAINRLNGRWNTEFERMYLLGAARIRRRLAATTARRYNGGRQQKSGDAAGVAERQSMFAQAMARWVKALIICATLMYPNLASAEQWLALTLAPDGAWGAAASDSSNTAMAMAIARCKERSSRPMDSITGCGALLRLARNGWGIAEICRTNWEMSVGRTLVDAELSLQARKLSLKYEHSIRTFGVSPRGDGRPRCEPTGSQPVTCRTSKAGTTDMGKAYIEYRSPNVGGREY